MRRRTFIKAAGHSAAALASGMEFTTQAARATNAPTILPFGNAPAPLAMPHFPSVLHAFVWRNWPLVPLGRLAMVAGVTTQQIQRVAHPMGLEAQPRITEQQQRRSHLGRLTGAAASKPSLKPDNTLMSELGIALAASSHFCSVANQARFVMARNALRKPTVASQANTHLAAVERIVRKELELAIEMDRLHRVDSRIGFEASNQYHYMPVDLAEKVLKCRDLRERWLPIQHERWKNTP